MRLWDDECVVFNTASGHTHHLNALAEAALRALIANPDTADAVAQQVAAEFGVEPDADWFANFARLIASFDRLGVIEPVPPESASVEPVSVEPASVRPSSVRPVPVEPGS